MIDKRNKAINDATKYYDDGNFLIDLSRLISKKTTSQVQGSKNSLKEYLSDLIGEELKKLGILEADVIFISSKSLSVNSRLGKLEGTEQSEATNLGLRVIKDGKQLTISTTEISKESLIELAK